MHLAICDDHMADRKQMERLLGRESDRRLNTTGVLYVDSFGSKESILVTPMIYDAIFMDMTEDGCDAPFLHITLDGSKTAPAKVIISMSVQEINYRIFFCDLMRQLRHHVSVARAEARQDDLDVDRISD